MKEMRFTKMEGLGNDYIYVDCMAGEPASDWENLSIRMSDRHFGVGADGIILIMPSKVADFRMRMFNADGSEGKMCGNGSRCVAKYVYDNGLTRKTEVTLETLAGIKVLKMHLGADGKVDTVTVDMGEPILTAAEVPALSASERMVEETLPTAKHGDFAVTAVSMGNPHGVIFVDEITDELVLGAGPELERHSAFPDRANIEFVKVIDGETVQMRVWERGSGETLACGTGACATAVAAALTGRTNRKVTVKLIGGDLSIEWNEKDNHVYMTGPARTVFTGVWTL
ncbi:MAG: diaminopimelate epimerase [Prevotella sp.]|nr:diaminopimelate epimerase [Prevotella sp.]